MAKNRLVGLDACKGIAILLVTFGHIQDVLVGGGGVLSKICYSIELPIFFMASGIQFKYNGTENKSTRQFLSARLTRLIYPYITLSGINIFIEISKLLVRKGGEIKKVISLVKQTCSLWGIGALWFLPTIFFAEGLLYIYSRLKCKWKYSAPIMAMIVCFCLNDRMVAIFQSDSHNTANYLLIIGVRILLAFVFECIGYYTEPLLIEINRTTRNGEKIIALCAIVLCMALVQLNMGVNMRYGYIGNPIIEYCSATVMILSIFALMKTCKEKSIVWLSRNSLMIMGLQSLAVRIAYQFKNLAGNATGIVTLSWCMISFVSFMVVAIPIVELVNRKLPFILMPEINKKERV